MAFPIFLINSEMFPLKKLFYLKQKGKGIKVPKLGIVSSYIIFSRIIFFEFP